MNFLNNSLVGAGARFGTGAGAEIKSGSWSGPGVGLRDELGEVLTEWGPPTGPGSLASSSSIGSIRGGFRRGEQQGREPPEAISKIDLIGLGRGRLFFF